MKSKSKKSIAAVVVCVAVIATATAVNAASSQNEVEEVVDKSVYVDIKAPARGDIVITGEYVGKVEPSQSVTVFPKVGGEVLAVHFNAGDTVEAGDILCELDSTDLALTVAQTQATLAKAQRQANLSLEMAQDSLDTYRSNLDGGTNADLIKAEAAVRTAENSVEQTGTALRLARREYREAKNGGNSEDYTQKSLDDLRDSVTIKEAQLEAAQLGLEQAEETLRAAQKAMADGEVTTEKNVQMAEIGTDFSDQYKALEKLQKNLNDTRVKAPISGVVEKRDVDPYDMVSGSSPIYVISSKSLLTVSFSVPESALDNLAVGDAITVEKNGQTCVGAVNEISTMVGSKGLFDVKASVENPPFELRTGSSIKVYADTQKASGSLILPISCLNFDTNAAYVYIYEDGTAHRRVVEIGLSNNSDVEILSGISASDQVICTWNSRLADGAQVLLSGQDAQDSTPKDQQEAGSESAGGSEQPDDPDREISSGDEGADTAGDETPDNVEAPAEESAP